MSAKLKRLGRIPCLIVSICCRVIRQRVKHTTSIFLSRPQTFSSISCKISVQEVFNLLNRIKTMSAEHGSSLETRPSLLQRLKAGDDESW
jgi:hypothetical protein